MTAQESGPVSIIIFGATGDLAKKKLLPALFDLFLEQCLPKEVRLIGISRSNLTDESFRTFVHDTLAQKFKAQNPVHIEDFLSRFHFIQADATKDEGYEYIAQCLKRLDGESCSHKLYYLAVAPQLYETIFQHLKTSGLSAPCVFEGKTFWVRIAVEKPFGKDLETAITLDKELGDLFAEEQIFRIDHYLAKDAVANILAFRFSNLLFEPVWSNQYIERVHIRFCENFGIEGRGAFYDGVGALRDVGQNHVLQMLALTAMEDPGEVSAQAIRNARGEVLKKLRVKHLNEQTDEDATIKGQYASYKTEANVLPQSKTDTYFRIVAEIENERWQGVPFVLEGGKKLTDRTIDIRVQFKAVDSCMQTLLLQHTHEEYLKNELVISMYPKEEITIRFWVKKPGLTLEVVPKHFTFAFEENEFGRVRDAYEKLLLDCLSGDQTLFLSSDEMVHAWRFVAPILKDWDAEEPIVYQDNTMPMREITNKGMVS